MYVNAGVRAGRGPPMLRNRRFAQPAKTPFSARLLREATPVLQSWCCRERRCRGFSIRPETKEGPFVLKCADRLEGEGGNGRTNRCGPHRRFHGEASRFTASDPLRQTWGKVWRTLRGTSVRAGGVLQLSNGDESPEWLRQKEGRESVGGVEERWRIVRGLRTMAQSHGAVLSEDVLRGRREPRPDCLLSTIKGKKKRRRVLLLSPFSALLPALPWLPTSRCTVSSIRAFSISTVKPVRPSTASAAPVPKSTPSAWNRARTPPPASASAARKTSATA